MIDDVFAVIIILIATVYVVMVVALIVQMKRATKNMRELKKHTSKKDSL